MRMAVACPGQARSGGKVRFFVREHFGSMFQSHGLIATTIEGRRGLMGRDRVTWEEWKGLLQVALLVGGFVVLVDYILYLISTN